MKTKQRLLWIGVPSLLLIIVLVITSTHFSARAVPAAPAGGAPGTWAVGGGGNASYLVNTSTGEVWALNGTVKQLVVETKAAPGK